MQYGNYKHLIFIPSQVSLGWVDLAATPTPWKTNDPFPASKTTHLLRKSNWYSFAFSIGFVFSSLPLWAAVFRNLVPRFSSLHSPCQENAFTPLTKTLLVTLKCLSLAPMASSQDLDPPYTVVHKLHPGLKVTSRSESS